MLAKTCRHNLLAIARAYAQAAGVSLGTVSKNFYGNRTFLADFRAGKTSVSVDKLDEMLAKFASEWPAGARWPMLRAVLVRGPAKKIVPKPVARPGRITYPPAGP